MTRQNVAPTSLFGGKAALAARIAALLPPHAVYVEPYLGSGAVFFCKRPAPIEVISDVDGLIVNFFRVLRDPVKGARLKELLTLTPYAREEWAECSAGLKMVARGWDNAADDVEVARRWFAALQMSFAARSANGLANEHPNWRYATKPGHNPAASFRAAIDRLPSFVARLANAQIEHDDALAIIARYDGKNVCQYLDPPYLPDTRRGGGYAHEMTLDDHTRLLDTITAPTFKSAVVLSGYDSHLYRERLEDALPPERRWQSIEITVACSAAGRVRAGGAKLQGKGSVYAAGQTRVEVLWLNPAAQQGHGLWGGDLNRDLSGDLGDALSGEENNTAHTPAAPVRPAAKRTRAKPTPARPTPKPTPTRTATRPRSRGRK